MKTEELIEFGLTEEQAKHVMAQHGKTITTLNAQLDTLRQSEADLKSQLSSRDEDLAKLQKDNDDNEELKAQIDTLTKEYKDLEAQSVEKLHKFQRDSALKLVLANSKAKNVTAVHALLDQDKISFKDGELSGVKEQLEALQQSDAYLFDLGTKQSKYNPSQGESLKQFDSFEQAMEAGEVDSFFKQQLEESEE